MKKNILIVFLVLTLLLTGCTSRSVNAAITHAEELQTNARYQDALTYIDTQLVTHPHQQKLKEKRAELLLLTEQYDQYLAERPSFSEKTQRKLNRSYIIALMKAGETADAITQIDQLIAKKPTSDAYQLRGQALSIQGDHELAISAFDEALLLEPTNIDALVNKAIVLADTGKLYESLDLLDQAIALTPDDHILRYNKGTVLSDLGYQQRNVAWTGSFSYYGDALRHFETAYRLNQTYQNTVIWLWITYLDLSQHKKAHQALDTALSTNPKARDARYYKAKTYAAEGNIDAAKKTYTDLLALNPNFELAKQELVLLEQKATVEE
jgi:tetratricopeptide (TPR) repeat protein